VTAVNKVFDVVDGKPSKRSRVKQSTTSVKVDVVANGGKNWIRVNTLVFFS
jgi:hypothetical protein